ncbi:MAG: hypothetical protein JNJ92_02440 [Altererythrobacter sp.]|nr:hypothetical protein [Altererythrobacter sp.]
MPVWQSMLLPFTLLRGTLGDTAAAFAPVLLYVAMIWACMEYLRRRSWIVRI